MTEFRLRAGNAAREGTAPASPGRRTPSLRVRAVPGRRQAGRACHRGVHAYRLACLRTSGFLETARVRGRGTFLTRAHPGTGRSRHASERLGPARAGRPAHGDRCRAGQHRCGAGPASVRPRRLDIPRAAAGRKGCRRLPCPGSGTGGACGCRGTPEFMGQRLIPCSRILTLIVRNIIIIAQAAVVVINRSSGSRHSSDCIGR